jgi:hypothetical protein
VVKKKRVFGRHTVSFRNLAAIAVRTPSGDWEIIVDTGLAQNERAFYAQMLEQRLRDSAEGEDRVLIHIAAGWSVATLGLSSELPRAIGGGADGD